MKNEPFIVNEDHVLFERDGYQLVIKTIGNDLFEIQYRFVDGHYMDYTLDRLFPKMSISDIEKFLTNAFDFLQIAE